jgi:RNA polymerase sigma-70 factor (ECF subfamily)
VNIPLPTSPDADADHKPPPPGEARARTPAEETRLAAMVDQQFDFVWRSLRRCGLAADAADDAAQQVFIVASRRMGDIQIGAERSFLFQTALRIASDMRRARVRRREQLGTDAEIAEVRDSAPSPEEEVHRKRSLALLDEILGSLEEELRLPFVLFELEGIEVKDIANILGVPVGTAASRLRIAREEFHAIAKRMRARHAFQGRSR